MNYIEDESPKWCSRSSNGIVTRQDAISKVDIPYFSVESTMNLTSFMYDITGHGNAVDGEVLILSHEKGAPPKGRSDIMK